VPIDAEAFEEIDDDEPMPDSNAARILGFLRTNSNQAFRQSEIAEATGVTQGSVGPTLVRLRERGRVDHRGKYWRISDHEQSVDAGTGHASDSLASREADQETPVMEEWKEHAVDPRVHRDGK